MSTRRDPRQGAGTIVFTALLTMALFAVVFLSHPPRATAATSLKLGDGVSAKTALRGHNPSKASDDNRVTRWAANSFRYPQWWQVDLGDAHHVVKTTILWHRRAAPRKYFYRLWGSADGQTWRLLADRSRRSAYGHTTDRFDATVRYVRIDVLRSTRGRASIREVRVIGDAATSTATTEAPQTPPATAPTRSLVMTADDVARLRGLIATSGSAEAAAWTYFRSGRVAAAMKAVPVVDPGPTKAFSYTKLDTDSRYARNLGVAYAATGEQQYAAKAAQYLLAWARGNTPAPYSFTNDVQGGYHQSYGAFSFAFAYDLTKDAGVYTDADHGVIQTWFRTWAGVMKGYQDEYAGDYWFTHTGRGTYKWVPSGGRTYDYTDWYTGRDAAMAPASAWLAAALVSGDTTSLATLFDPGYTLNVPAMLHASCAPDNDGDGRGTGRVPQVLIMCAGYYDNSSRGGNLDYMSYNARLASLLYQMTENAGLATAQMKSELRTSWQYLSKFAGPAAEPPVAPNDAMHWDLYLCRMQMAAHVHGDAVFVADVTGGQYSRAKFYESQYLGPTTLTQVMPQS